MRRLICWVFCMFVAVGCLPGTDDEVFADTDTDTDVGSDTDTDTDTGIDTETETSVDTETGTDSDTDTETESEETCINATCETHDDCGCHDAGFCVPELAGVDVFWDVLTCTLDCTGTPDVCLSGYHCVEIPEFVDSIYPDVFPGSLCAKDAETDTDSGTDEAIERHWIYIHGGSYHMGSDAGRENELPVHLVVLEGFDMLQSEVTVGQYRECVDAGACSEPGSGVNATWPNKTNHPVNYVDWFQAGDYCQWAGGSLPTEAQWEYAATNGGQSVLYPWGDSIATCATTVIKENGDGCGDGTTMAVCSKHDGNTDQGLCDMHGNVWEWIQDWYHPTYDGAPSDGSPWLSPEGEVRITRGGAFSYDGTYNVRYRNDHADPNIQFQSDGFRCARGVGKK